MSGSLHLLFLLFALLPLAGSQKEITNCDDHGGRTLFKLRPKDAEKGFVAFVCEHNFVKEKDHWLLYSRRLLRLKHTMMGGKITCIESYESSFIIWCGYRNCSFPAEEMMRLCREEREITPLEQTAHYEHSRIENYNSAFEQFLFNSGFYLIPAYLALILVTMCISTTTFAK